MNRNELVNANRSRLIADLARRYIFLTNRPVSRLARDVEDIARFEGPGPFSPQLRLIIAAPPLVSASAEILDATVRVWGDRFFAEPSKLLQSMALLGPIAAAEAFILLSSEITLVGHLQAAGEAFASVFERYPHVFLADTRKLLMQYSKGKVTLRGK